MPNNRVLTAPAAVICALSAMAAWTPVAEAGSCARPRASYCAGYGVRAHGFCDARGRAYRAYRYGSRRCFSKYGSSRYGCYDREYFLIYTPSRGSGPHYDPGRADVRFYRRAEPASTDRDAPRPIPSENEAPTPIRPDSVITISYRPPVSTVTLPGAWGDLLARRAEQAAERFAMDSVSSPTAGAPKVGFALAALLRGEEQEAVWAMRRAFRVGHESLDAIPDEPALGEMIERMAGEYSTPESADERFMRAALLHFGGDAEAARGAAQEAIAEGDDSASAHRLLEACERATLRSTSVAAAGPTR